MPPKIKPTLRQVIASVFIGIRTLRGIRFIAAVTLVAEIGDLHRFDSPKKLMAWLGLVPAEHSSGTRARRGELTRTGNAADRAMLIESAWQYRYPAREGRALRERSARRPVKYGPSPGRRRPACARSSAVWPETGKHAAKIVAAVARELVGFIWDIARHTPGAGPKAGLTFAGSWPLTEKGEDRIVDIATWLACCAP